MRVVRWLDANVEKTCLGLLLVAMTAVLVAQIVLRTFFHSSLAWAEEVSRFMLVWSGFLSVSYTIRNNTAMRLTMILAVLPRLARNTVLIAAQTCMLLFFAILTWMSLELLGATQQYSPALELPLVYVYVVIPIGFALTVTRTVQNLVRMIAGFRTGDEAGMEAGAKEDELLKEIEADKEAADAR